MERSGRRETISTRSKSFPARSSRVGSVNGKSIIVPRMKASLTVGSAQDGNWSASYHHSRPTAQSREPRTPRAYKLQAKWPGVRVRQKSFRLQKQLIFETMPLTAEAPVSRPWWLGLPGLPVYDARLFGALRDSTTGFRAEGVGR